jgi:hypothetical protein
MKTLTLMAALLLGTAMIPQTALADGGGCSSCVVQPSGDETAIPQEPRDSGGCNGCATPLFVAPRLADGGGCTSCAVQDPDEPIVQQEPRDGCSQCALPLPKPQRASFKPIIVADGGSGGCSSC